MADRWAKLHSKISDSADFAAVADENPFAAMLFLLLLPQADVYGIVRAEPGWLRWNVCRKMDVTEEQIGKALECLGVNRSKAPLIVRYRADRGEYLWLPGWDEHQDTRWDRVGPPEHPCPPGWQPPAGLLLHCQQDPSGKLAGVIPEWSGSDPGVVPFDSTLDTESDTESERTDSQAGQKTRPARPKEKAAASEKATKKQRKPTEVQSAVEALAVEVMAIAWWPEGQNAYAAAGFLRKKLGDDVALAILREYQDGIRDGPPNGANPYAWLQVEVQRISRERDQKRKRSGGDEDSDWEEPVAPRWDDEPDA